MRFELGLQLKSGRDLIKFSESISPETPILIHSSIFQQTQFGPLQGNKVKIGLRNRSQIKNLIEFSTLVMKKTHALILRSILQVVASILTIWRRNFQFGVGVRNQMGFSESALQETPSWFLIQFFLVKLLWPLRRMKY